MKGEIINVGTEIILGNIVNTHAQYLSEKLAELGIDIYYHVSVGDNHDRVKGALKTALDRSDIIILTGGLGPTEDDMTKEAVAQLLDKKLIFDDEIMKSIDVFFKNRETQYSDSIKKQAYIIEGSKPLPNQIGTAPGLYLEDGNKIIIILPGPPRELTNVFENNVMDLLEEKTNELIQSCVMRFSGIGESDIEAKLLDLIDAQTNPTIATYVKEEFVEVRVTAKADTIKNAKDKMKSTVKEIEDRLGKYLFSKDGKKIEEVVFDLLCSKDLKVGFCESCTGGLVSSRFTRIAGTSRVFERGIVTYSNTAKMDEVNVSEQSLSNYGAVSKQVALEMAKGLFDKTGIDIAISITGIAGPTGQTKDKPVGLVYFGVVTKDWEYTTKRVFVGDRERVQNKAANTAFELIREFVEEM